MAGAPEGVENLALHPQQPGFDRGGPAQSPEERREAMHKLLLDRRLRQVLGDDCVLEGPILLRTLSSGSMTVSAVNPCFRALRRDRCFPSRVLGPVLLRAL